MPIDLLVQHFWLSISVWAALAVADSWLTILCARLYRDGARNHVVLGRGHELNPLFPEDVEMLRPLGPRFMLFLALTYLVAWVTWLYAVEAGRGAHVYEFLAGLLVLGAAASLTRTCRNYVLYSHLASSRGVEGTVRYAAWLTLRLGAFDLVVFALAFGAMGLLSGRVFFGGGCAGCLVNALSQWRISEQARRDDEDARDGEGPGDTNQAR